MKDLVRYRTLVEDSARWEGFPFRADDIVIDTPPKSGTTWMQTLCAMLVLDRFEFDRPLTDISPWLDMLTSPLAEVIASLEAQQHRRFIKTHTPLDGVPLVDGVTYVCVARDPRDVALSFQHHRANLDLDAFMAVRARAVGIADLEALGPPPSLPDDPLERFWLWAFADAGRFVGPSLVDVLHHVETFWERRHDPRIHLFHYADLLADLPGQVRRLAAALDVGLTDERAEQVAAATTFDRMRERADELVPEVGKHLWLSNQDFFHRGYSGQWRELLDAEGLARYERRVADLVPAEVAAWAHGGWTAGLRQTAIQADMVRVGRSGRASTSA